MNVLLIAGLLLVTSFPAQPTQEELEAAKKAFRKLGGRFVKLPFDKQTIHCFLLPGKTKDEDLKNVPDVSFSFGLSLANSKVTDAGLKELANVKNLILLILSETKVTDAGLKELANLKNLTSLGLGYTQVTDAGMKELARLKNL